jgi:hypothetical protein
LVDVSADTAVPLSIKRSAITQIGPARENKQGAGSAPRLLDNDVSCHGDDSVSGREQTP